MKIRRIITFCLLVLTPLFASAQANNEWNRKDANGLKYGPWKGFYPGGQLRYVGQFEKDQAVDTFRYYFEDGKMKSLLIHQPEQANKVLAIHFYQTGDTLAKGFYVNQKKNGVWMSYGAKSVPVERGAYKDDKKHGKWTIYYPTGVISEEIHYKEGIEDGPYKTYFENGQIRQDAFYLNGAWHGQMTYYAENGKKEEEGEYKQNLRDGKWIVYDKNELVVKIYEYENGKLLNPDKEDSSEYNTEEFRNQRKDQLEFEDLRGRIKYE